MHHERRRRCDDHDWDAPPSQRPDHGAHGDHEEAALDEGDAEDVVPPEDVAEQVADADEQRVGGLAVTLRHEAGAERVVGAAEVPERVVRDDAGEVDSEQGAGDEREAHRRNCSAAVASPARVSSAAAGVPAARRCPGIKRRTVATAVDHPQAPSRSTS